MFQVCLWKCRVHIFYTALGFKIPKPSPAEDSISVYQPTRLNRFSARDHCSSAARVAVASEKQLIGNENATISDYTPYIFYRFRAWTILYIICTAAIWGFTMICVFFQVNIFSGMVEKNLRKVSCATWIL